jgi:hypothetical protein
MNDAYEDLYETKREACEVGKYLGASDAIRRAGIRLSLLSGKYEKAGDAAKFHAVEECCGELRTIADMIEHNRERDQAGGNHS